MLNISGVQKAMRGYMNMNPGAATPAIAVLVTAGFFGAAPVCPSAGTYAYSLVNPVPVGTAYATCNFAGPPLHVPASTVNW